MLQYTRSKWQYGISQSTEPTALSLGDGSLSAKELISLFQSSDLLLPSLHALLIAHLNLQAVGLEVLEVVLRAIQLLLGCLEVLLELTLLKLRLVLLKLELHLALVLLQFISLCILHEGRILGSSLVLRGLCFGLKANKIALNDLEHSDDTTARALCALVSGHLRHLAGLNQAGLRGVKLSEHHKSLLHSRDRCLSVRDSGLVL